MALIPIRANRDIVGLLQLNDRKKDCFTLEQIHFFEGISASIGVALMRKQQEDALRESEARHRLLFDGSRDAHDDPGSAFVEVHLGQSGGIGDVRGQGCGAVHHAGAVGCIPRAAARRQPLGRQGPGSDRGGPARGFPLLRVDPPAAGRHGFPLHRAADPDRDGRPGISPGHRARHHRPEAGRGAHPARHGRIGGGPRSSGEQRRRAGAHDRSTAIGEGPRRGRHARQERVPGQHEPRDPHAHERRHRHDRAAAGHRA